MKLSEEFWDKYSEKHLIFHSCLPSIHRSDYDELLSLEARIELLKAMNRILSVNFTVFIEQNESKLSELAKKHNLKEEK